jgi:hypothetical protein
MLAIALVCLGFALPVVSQAGTPAPVKSVKKLGEQITAVSLMYEMLELDKGIKKTPPCTQYYTDYKKVKSDIKDLNADTAISDAEYDKRFEILEAKLNGHQIKYKRCFSDKFKSISKKLKLSSVLELETLGLDGFERKYKQLKKTYYDPEAIVNYKEERNVLEGRQNRLILVWLLDNFQEVRDFRGMDDRKISRGSWKSWIKLHAKTKLVETAISYKGIHNKVSIPGETLSDQRDGIVRGYLRNAPLVSMVAGEGKFIQLLSGDDLPPDHRHDNPYAAMTAATEAPLQRKIKQASPHSLLPEDVLKLSLDVCDGSYPLAVMTGHSVLKTVTKRGRSVIERMFARARNGKWEKIPELAKKLKPYSDIARRLHNLRPGDDETGDKLGPWYHGFGLLSAGALSSPEGASIGARGEHMSKYLGWFIGEGGYNAEKEYTDIVFSDATFPLRKYNRYYDPSVFE